MQDLKVTLVQTIQFWEDKQANLDYLETKLDVLEPTDLVLLPEMFQTGFSMNVDVLAENMDDSISLSWLKNQSKKHQAAFYTSFICSENGKFYNRGCFVKPDGSVTVYDKRKLFRMAHEDDYFTAGNTVIIVDWKDWKINLQICYDLRFPELSRNFINSTGEANYDLCLYVANWPERRTHHWKSLLPARAIENQCYVCGVNRVGTDGKDLIYSGESMAINALGESLNEIMAHQEVLQCITFSKNDLNQIRKQLNFLPDVDL